MRAFNAFCKKEWMELARTYKLAIMLAVFLIFGIMSPMMALLLPDILNGSDLGGGIILQLPEPAAIDSYLQFFGNIGQMGMIVLVIVFAGIMANEFSKDTLINVLTKGMPRRTILLAKFMVSTVTWTISYLLALGVTFLYTEFFWSNHSLPHAFWAFAGPWVYGIFLIALMILSGVLFKTFTGSLMVTGAVAIVLSLLNISPAMQKFNPISLADRGVNLLNGSMVPADLLPAFYISGALILVTLSAAVILFDRKQV
jgi:ABC-2 type transport system permease protein